MLGAGLHWILNTIYGCARDQNKACGEKQFTDSDAKTCHHTNHPIINIIVRFILLFYNSAA